LSTRKTDRRFRNRYALRNALLLVPPLLALVLIWSGSGRLDLAFWAAVVFFVAWIAVWIVLDARLLRAYVCPSCGRRIPDPTIPNRSAGDPIRYRCSACDVEWDTGLRESGEW
jgi:hypothetical protein